MALLKLPTERPPKRYTAGLVYGYPGLGKTTLALSILNSVILDYDDGLDRVQPQYRVASIVPATFDEVLELIMGTELDGFNNIVSDTVGRCLELMDSYLIRENPKLGKKDGSLTLQGYGARKYEFQRLIALIRRKNKHQVYVAHAKEERNGEELIVRPDIGGSSGADLAKDMDYIGFMESYNGKRTITFTPTDKFYAKNSLMLPPHMDVPDPATTGNTFLQTWVVDKLLEKNDETLELSKKYDAIMREIVGNIEAINTPEEALEEYKKIREPDESLHLWDSHTQAKLRFRAKIDSLGLKYNKEGDFFYDGKDNTVDSE